MKRKVNFDLVVFSLLVLFVPVFLMCFCISTTKIVTQETNENASCETIMQMASEEIGETGESITLIKSYEDVELYVMQTENHLYLVGAKYENGVLHYVDVEKELL